MTMNNIEENQQMLEDIQHRESKLTDWEAKFIDSIEWNIGRGKGLSPRQQETLESIWEKVT